MFGGLFWLIALLVVLAVGGWGVWQRLSRGERSPARAGAGPADRPPR